MATCMAPQRPSRQSRTSSVNRPENARPPARVYRKLASSGMWLATSGCPNSILMGASFMPPTSRSWFHAHVAMLTLRQATGGPRRDARACQIMDLCREKASIADYHHICHLPQRPICSSSCRWRCRDIAYRDLCPTGHRPSIST